MQSKTKNTKIFIISGPSGVGKTSVAKGVLKKLTFLKTSVTYTTRNKRLGKKEDKTIIHVTEDEFRQKINGGDFLEWAIVHDNFYGTDKKTILARLANNSILMNIDVQGALQIKNKLPKNTVLIFLKAENLTELIRRIKQREKMPEAIFQLRLKNAKKELALAKKYDYTVYNKSGQVQRAIAQIQSIIKQELR